MPSFFQLVLDTLGPQNVATSINSGAIYATSRSTTLTTTTDDTPTTGYQMKVWGDVDASVNPNIQPTEAASAWITFSASQAVTLSTGDGSKTISVRLRDDVYNPSSVATDSITLDTTAPVITIQSGPTPGRISEQPSKDTATVVWQSSEAIVAYEVAVVASGSSVRGSGTVIPSAAGSTNVSGGAVAANTNVTTTIKGTDYRAAVGTDGTRTVKIFGQDAAGIWSVGS